MSDGPVLCAFDASEPSLLAAYAALFEGAFGSPASLGRILLYELSRGR